MTSANVDFSAEAVERLAGRISGYRIYSINLKHMDTHTEAAATLRALASRVAVLGGRLTAAEAQSVRDVSAAYVERDAARAEAGRLREALEKINQRETYNADSYGPCAEIARAALKEASQ